MQPSTKHRTLYLILVVFLPSIVILPGAFALGWVGGVVGVLLTGMFVVLAVFSRFRPLIVLTATHIGHRGMAGGIRWVPRSLPRAVVQGDVFMGRTTQHTVFVADGAGQRLLRFSDEIFDRSALDRLVAELRLPVYRLERRVSSPKQINELYPGLIGWPERHRFLVAFLIVISVVVLVALTSTVLIPRP
ncbi:hypothetical protein TL08_15300 [Actinoalloteichus hymeniacidonis]|uniref:PH domain-containing protein n=1 Tax=Actinoalloteichus hymeniacidonis TaxID=340345 RepID=A0AAC9MYW3_9PSEU|nr:hypothetical protein TL08_15300 [Actinoalloteichus hymeniacidonis]